MNDLVAPTPEQLLHTIFGYAARIANEKSLHRLLTLMADMGKDMIIADRCTIWLFDQEKQELWTTVAHGVRDIRMPARSGLVGHAIQKGKPLIIDDAYDSPHFNPKVDQQTGYRTKAMLVIPIKNSEDVVIGAYQAINKLNGKAVFTATDLAYLTLAASYSGKSLEAAMLHKEIEDTQREILFRMGEIGESRSKETGQHVKRVAEYSRLLALRYGLSEQGAELIQMASPMHDIGKVAIPDSILHKPSKLTAEEYDTMKSHTEIGYNLLNNSSRRLVRAAAIIAREHHEKWDGTGYPRGLCGEDIHIYGRITALADVFDALGSDRVYKKAWPIERILGLFREESGRHFDPSLVDVFLHHLDEFLAIRDRYRE
ncbi:GAF domain-containing protein [Aneurinibacillus soli]|uniref:Cyclic di-GMP phosphodiesterase response regulator RpfG n=1 Tax=Aneurinibacillus soli TaxID=1500254 RepID=A0A0U5BAT7_9BACL|nr:HD domain-containing phosphohydrolase [Aneurinibacillus soli]PYE64063.1 GAF domain-containing protein [Aneurinibacillus soli]BAU28012.1 Cyclic di-GMP phosphodiesterase response regulator RpfG [Aneurinibacillus soli]